MFGMIFPSSVFGPLGDRVLSLQSVMHPRSGQRAIPDVSKVERWQLGVWKSSPHAPIFNISLTISGQIINQLESSKKPERRGVEPHYPASIAEI
jgi:hypothetical protein